MFFSRFNFHRFYGPGSKNTKLDALSRVFESPAQDPAPDTILLPEVFISTIPLGIEETLLGGVITVRHSRCLPS